MMTGQNHGSSVVVIVGQCPSLASQMAHTSHVSADQMSHECWSVTHVYMYQSDGVLMLAR